MNRTTGEAAGDMLAAALNYAERGWHVIPLHDVTAGACSCVDGASCSTPGKHPRITRWQHRASADAATMAEWWRRWPAANVGIATGARSGLLVLDVDPRHGGDDELAALEAERGRLPETVAVVTGGGGMHYYFAHPGGEIRSRTLAPGLELKADGTFVVAPPSRTGEAP
jgi:putative DNA primase/helicase